MAEKKKKSEVAEPAPKKVSKKKTEVVHAATNGAAHTAPAHDDIARRAYELYCERGGHAMENWLQAERELRGL